MTTTNAPRTGDVRAPRPIIAWGASTVRRLLPELMAFGGVGLIAFAVDLGAFNLFRVWLFPDQVVLAKVASVTIATVVAWIGHRHLTYRSRRGRPLAREALMFAAANIGGLVIAAGCLAVSHYVLGFRSALADNIAGNVVGLGLGTLFRFLCYRLLVFRAPTPPPAPSSAAASTQATASTPIPVHQGGTIS